MVFISSSTSPLCLHLSPRNSATCTGPQRGAMDSAHSNPHTSLPRLGLGQNQGVTGLALLLQHPSRSLDLEEWRPEGGKEQSNYEDRCEYHIEVISEPITPILARTDAHPVPGPASTRDTVLRLFDRYDPVIPHRGFHPDCSFRPASTDWPKLPPFHNPYRCTE